MDSFNTKNANESRVVTCRNRRQEAHAPVIHCLAIKTGEGILTYWVMNNKRTQRIPV